MITASQVPTTLTSAVCDATYIAVGVGVVAAQRIQTKAQALARRLDDRFETIETKIEAAVDRVERRLPAQAEHLLGQARGVTRVARDQLRTFVRPAA
jgi:ABC-type transporter Mla subunit MlaD